MTVREQAQCALIALLAMVEVERRSFVCLWEVFPPTPREMPRLARARSSRRWRRAMWRAFLRAESELMLSGWYSVTGWRGEARAIERAIEALEESGE